MSRSAWLSGALLVALIALSLPAAAAAGRPSRTATPDGDARASGPAPLVFHAPGDSVRFRLGEYDRWFPLAAVPSPDTSWLGPGHDLVLVSASDSAVVPCARGPATVRFVRDADTLTAVFVFETRARRDLELYRALLAQYPRFGRGGSGPPLAFERPGAYARDSADLRARFPLDSIAGQGGQLARARRLLHWLHAGIRYDGSKEGPACTTIGDCLQTCFTHGATMNCGGFASCYAAVCRAVGIPARQVVCMPFDTEDPDCHSVTIVYSDSLRRWIYLDATFEAWWTDARGRLLGLEDARALIARGEPVRVNPEANMSGEPREEIEHLAYMGKNLFRFRTWLASGAPLDLVPLGYSAGTAEPRAGWNHGDAAQVTSDAAAFWVRPAGR
jgi:hypothetical protein